VFVVPYLKLFVLEPDPHCFVLYCSSVSDPDSRDPDPDTLLNPDPDPYKKLFFKCSSGNIFLIKNGHRCLFKPLQVTRTLFKNELSSYSFFFWDNF
jgi:hypothetical protein